MSLVGPRPPLPQETEQYTDLPLASHGGASGHDGAVAGLRTLRLTFDEMVRLDLFYIENWSVGFDMGLMLRTIPAVLFARGAY